MSCQVVTGPRGGEFKVTHQPEPRAGAPETRSPDMNGWGRGCEQPGLAWRRRQPPSTGGPAPALPCTAAWAPGLLTSTVPQVG